MRPRTWIYPVACGMVGLALVTGCGRKAADAHKTDDGHRHAQGEKSPEHKESDGDKHRKEEKDGGHEEGEKGGVAFKEGRGLQLSPEIIKALGVTTVEAMEQPLAAELKIAAQVFATKPQVLATASMPQEEAERLEKQSFTGGKITRVDRTAHAATQMVEVVFAVERAAAPELGDFVTIALVAEQKSVLAVPRSAVLDSATGTFVYVVNGEFYLRTAVKLGVRSADYVEITDGLYSGDMVVVSPVDQLWLAELRLTKGGGHSH